MCCCLCHPGIRFPRMASLCSSHRTCVPADTARTGGRASLQLQPSGTGRQGKPCGSCTRGQCWRFRRAFATECLCMMCAQCTMRCRSTRTSPARMACTPLMQSQQIRLHRTGCTRLNLPLRSCRRHTARPLRSRCRNDQPGTVRTRGSTMQSLPRSRAPMQCTRARVRNFHRY